MGKDIRGWTPEDEGFWERGGRAVANRNLWISIPSLLCGFAVWLYWGIITVQMLNLGFPFEKPELFTLSAVAGLAGATLRIPSTFFIRIAGGRNTIFLTTLLLVIPAAGTGLALRDPATPLWQFQILAFLSGIGGGNFASSMSNISFFFPKRVQGYALGMNAGLGNFGVTTMQILVPLVMTMSVFGGDPLVLENTSGTLIGKIPAGSDTWIHNAGFVWLVFLIPLGFATWFGMNNVRDEHVSPNIGHPFRGFAIILVMLAIGLFTAACGLWLMLPEEVGGSGFDLSKWLVLPLVIAGTVGLLRLLPGEVGRNLHHQYRIFDNKHTWAMTVIYTMTFGSFIGYAATFALATKVVFGFSHVMVDGVMTHDTVNPNGPSALTWAWMGPFVGALIRPVGGTISDRIGGAKVTPDHLRGDGRERARGRLGPRAGLCVRDPGAVLRPLPDPVPHPVRGHRDRQRLDLPHHRGGVRPRAGGAGARLDLGGGGLRRVRHPEGVRRADPGHHPGVRALRLRRLLRGVHRHQLVVLPAEGRLCPESLKRSATPLRRGRPGPGRGRDEPPDRPVELLPGDERRGRSRTATG